MESKAATFIWGRYKTIHINGNVQLLLLLTQQCEEGIKFLSNKWISSQIFQLLILRAWEVVSPCQSWWNWQHEQQVSREGLGFR